MQNEQTRTYLVLSYWNCTASSFSFISVMSRLRVTSFVRVSSLWQSKLCEWLEFHMHVRASESTHFYLVPTPRFGFALYGTCIHPSLQYANPLRAPIIRAGSVCAARHERTFACARCHPAPGSAARAQSTPIWARRCHPQWHRRTHCCPLRDVTTHRRSAWT